MKHIQILVILGIMFSSFSITNLDKTEDHSTLLLKMNYKSLGLKGFGGNLIIRNLETNEVFKSVSKIGFSPFIIIEDLPIGEYEVLELKIISGGPIISIRDKNLFNTIKLESPKNYYLGNYLTTKIKPIFKLNIAVSRKEKDSERTIVKQLRKKSEEWLDLKIDYENILFKVDRTEIEIR